MSDVPLYKIPGPRLLLLLLSLFFGALFVAGFYWDSYVLPARTGPWVIETPRKYFLMFAFLMFSIVAFCTATPLVRYIKTCRYLTVVAFVSFLLGVLVLF